MSEQGLPGDRLSKIRAQAEDATEGDVKAMYDVCAHAVPYLLSEIDRLTAATERADRLEADGNAMAELLEEMGSPGAWYIPESGTEVYIAGCHARCQAHGATDRWRALVGGEEES